MKNRLPQALTAYAALAVLAAFTISDPKVRGVVWIALAAFALKSYIAARLGDH